MRTLFLAVITAIVAGALWFLVKPTPPPPASQSVTAVTTRHQDVSAPAIVAAPEPITVNFGGVAPTPLPAKVEESKEIPHLTASAVTPFEGKLVAVSADHPYVGEIALFLHRWANRLTDEQRRQIEEAYIRLKEARLQYEGSIAHIDRSVTEMTTISIPPYPQAGLQLRTDFQSAVTSIAGATLGTEFNRDFDALLYEKNAGMGDHAQKIVITKNDDGSDDPYYRIDFMTDTLTGPVKSNTFVLKSQLPTSPLVHLTPYLPK